VFDQKIVNNAMEGMRYDKQEVESNESENKERSLGGREDASDAVFRKWTVTEVVKNSGILGCLGKGLPKPIGAIYALLNNDDRAVSAGSWVEGKEGW
jgi:hypothetical protein